MVLQHGRHASDAIALRQLTRLPRALWAALLADRLGRRAAYSAARMLV